MALHPPGRLTARPTTTHASRTAAPGTVPLAGGALLRVPPAAEAGTACPLVVAFHGAGSTARAGLALLADLADDAGAIVLAPASLGSTWDAIRGELGPDVERLDGALAEAFATCPVDPARVVLAGFSDGASYALSLGLTNGDLVTHLVAFSPGFMAPAARRGRPPAFVSHGVDDPVLPIDRCGRRVVAQLERAGHAVTYEEFDGGHAVPVEIARRALSWVGVRPAAR